LDFFIIDQAEFWCSRVLPWARTEQLHFKWNVWKFDRTIADIERKFFYPFKFFPVFPERVISPQFPFPTQTSTDKKNI